MALESVAITPGAGADVAVDTIAGKHLQVNKPGWGADGTHQWTDTPTPLPTAPGARTTPLLSRATIDRATSGDGTAVVAAGGAGTFVRVYGWFFKVAAAVDLKWKHGATDFFPALPFGIGDGWVQDITAEPYLVCGDNEPLYLNLSAAVQASGVLYYRVEA